MLNEGARKIIDKQLITNKIFFALTIFFCFYAAFVSVEWSQIGQRVLRLLP